VPFQRYALALNSVISPTEILTPLLGGRTHAGRRSRGAPLFWPLDGTDTFARARLSTFNYAGSERAYRASLAWDAHGANASRRTLTAPSACGALCAKVVDCPHFSSHLSSLSLMSLHSLCHASLSPWDRPKNSLGLADSGPVRLSTHGGRHLQHCGEPIHGRDAPGTQLQRTCSSLAICTHDDTSRQQRPAEQPSLKTSTSSGGAPATKF